MGVTRTGRTNGGDEMTLADLIDRLTALRVEHGGDLDVTVTDGSVDTELKAEGVTVYEAELGKAVILDLTV